MKKFHLAVPYSHIAIEHDFVYMLIKHYAPFVLDFQVYSFCAYKLWPFSNWQSDVRVFYLPAFKLLLLSSLNT